MGICESPERPDLDITDPVLFLDFVASHTFCVPEDPASLFIDRLAGKWAIKNFSPARARSAATCRGRPALELDARGNFSTSAEIRKFPRGLSISVQTTNCRFSENLFHEFFHHLRYGKVDNLPPVRC